MFFLLFIVLFMILYIVAFKDDFTKEKIDKVAPVLVAFAFVIFVIAFIGSL